jgi:heme-degrading monooxygenase HmoA
MYARNVTVQNAPDKLDEVIQLWRESVVPSLKQQKGFKRAYLLVERSTGKVRTMGLWETEADLQASVGWNQEQIAKFTGFFTAPPNVEHYEVAVEV